MNLKSKNIRPFFDTSVIDSNINLINILSDENYGLPLIPGIYFNKDDNTGSKIISIYFNIKNSIEKLETIQNMIIDILRGNIKTFENIKISKSTYKISKKNLFYDFKSNIDDNNFISYITYKKTTITKKLKSGFTSLKEEDQSKAYSNLTNEISFSLLLHKFNKNKNNLLISEQNSNQPYFIQIFQNEFKDKTKSFYYGMFKEYIDERNKLLQYITNTNNNSGILAFSNIFELTHKINIDLQTQSKNKTQNQLSDYIIYNNNSSNIKPTTTTNTTTNSISNFFINENNRNNAPNLLDKIHDYDMLYLNIKSIETLNNEYIGSINKIYNNFYGSLNEYLDGVNELNLFNLIKNEMTVYLNFFKLIFNYVDKIVLFKSNQVNHEIKNQIYKQISTFETLYHPYLKWYEELIYPSINPQSLSNTTIHTNDFKKFIKNTIKNTVVPKTKTPIIKFPSNNNNENNNIDIFSEIM